MKYLFFDLDNTLTKSRQQATPEMLVALKKLANKFHISIVSGAELARMVSQVPIEATYFTQNGNQVYQKDKLIIKNILEEKEQILEHIKHLCAVLNIEFRDSMVEDRGSQITVSFTGFDAPQHIKDNFDPDRHIRLDLLDIYPYPNAFVAGSTGIDYIPKTKGQNILKYITDRGISPIECLYIGDALEKGCNDYSVVGIIPTFAVKNCEETLQFIEKIC